MPDALPFLSEALDFVNASEQGLDAGREQAQFQVMRRRNLSDTPLNLFVLREAKPRSQRWPDPQVERALQLMAAEPKRSWTVTRLARAVGLSRPAFARRFREATGSSPMRHLTRLRLERAAQLLRSTSAPLLHVAEAVGYTSEFAFNRAFKRHFSVAPGSYRRFAPRLAAVPMSMRAAA